MENKEIVSHLFKAGCKEGPSGRVRIPKEKIEEMVNSQRKDARER